MNNIGRARSSIQVRMSPEANSRVVDVLRPNDPVEVQGEAGEMLQVVSKRLMPPVIGFIPKSSVAKRIPRVKVFDPIALNEGTLLDAAPADLLAVEFESWLQAGGEPTWLFEDGNAPFLVGDKMRKSFEPFRAAWNTWFADVVKNSRTQTAKMDEWLTVVSGGMEMWSFRPERIFKDPTEGSAGLGWASPNDILHWTGRVRYSPKEWKYKLWYEVELVKLDRVIKGWYKANLLEEFVIPDVYVEADDRAGIAALFDMTHSKLRLPADSEITDAVKAKRNAPQYINVQNAIEKSKINHNLCGEFCVAALCGVDVIPLLKKWYQSSERGRTVLNEDRGTVIYDLQQMLGLFSIKSEIFNPEPTVAPATPGYLQKMLAAEKKALIGVGITSTGEVSYNGNIRHWLVIEEIVRMGNSGWVRVYNSFSNREEVYPYQRIFNINTSASIGLWVDVPDFKG